MGSSGPYLQHADREVAGWSLHELNSVDSHAVAVERWHLPCKLRPVLHEQAHVASAAAASARFAASAMVSVHFLLLACLRSSQLAHCSSCCTSGAWFFFESPLRTGTK